MKTDSEYLYASIAVLTERFKSVHLIYSHFLMHEILISFTILMVACVHVGTTGEKRTSMTLRKSKMKNGSEDCLAL